MQVFSRLATTSASYCEKSTPYRFWHVYFRFSLAAAFSSAGFAAIVCLNFSLLE